MTDPNGFPDGHGASRVAGVSIDTYNAELRDDEGFIGDRASGRAFRAFLDATREQVSRNDEDPLGETATADIGKRTLDRILRNGDAEAAGILIGTIEDFAQEFAAVVRRFLKLDEWARTQRIVVGGGLRASRIGELAIGRAAVLLKAAGQTLDLQAIRSDPDEAGLIGCAHLAPRGVIRGCNAILAVDIGGSNIRVGTVEIEPGASGLSAARVLASKLWKHAEEKPDRDTAVGRVVDMLKAQADHVRGDKRHLAPFIGVGCPGLIREDGSIEKGGQNLPGDWEHPGFNLPNLLRQAISSIEGRSTIVLMNNDAVVQGLSEAPFMRDVERWGVMTIGTGLGNARFTNEASDRM